MHCMHVARPLISLSRLIRAFRVYSRLTLVLEYICGEFFSASIILE
jgi:hypothetical protein